MAGLTLRCAGIDAETVGDIESGTGSFDPSAVTPSRSTLGHDCPGRRGLRCHVAHIRPQHRRPASADFSGRDIDGGAAFHGDCGRLVIAAGALPAAAHQHLAAAGLTAGVELAAGLEGNRIAFEQDAATI